MLRRSPKRLGGGGDVPMPITDAAKCPPADEQTGLFFQKNNGSLAMLRLIDPRWILNRFVSLGRDGYVAGSVLYAVLWTVYWYIPNAALFGDKQPPRKVDWNAEKSGNLPKGFQMTQL